MEGFDAPLSMEEVQEAVNQMPSDKALDPDGLTCDIFQGILGHNKGGCNGCHSSFQ
jgi:hypothetical protein